MGDLFFQPLKGLLFRQVGRIQRRQRRAEIGFGSLRRVGGRQLVDGLEVLEAQPILPGIGGGFGYVRIGGVCHQQHFVRRFIARVFQLEAESLVIRLHHVIIRGDDQYRFILRWRIVQLMAFGQDIAMTQQLGAQMPRPARRIPAIAGAHQRHFLEQDAEAVVGQDFVETLQRILGLGIHRDHQVACLGRPDLRDIGVQRVRFQHHLHPCLCERGPQAITCLAGPGQQDGAALVSHVRVPGRAVRSRCAAIRFPDTACRDSGSRPGRRRAGDACRRYAR